MNENFTGFIHDRPLYTGNCDCTHRRRIDHRIQIGFIHDIPLYTGNCDCTHRRIDHRIQIGNTMLCDESDEEKKS